MRSLCVVFRTSSLTCSLKGSTLSTRSLKSRIFFPDLKKKTSYRQDVLCMEAVLCYGNRECIVYRVVKS